MRIMTPAQTQIDAPLFAAVRAGLTASPKSLPAWLFYDDAGSRLFERITALPEYYLTRTEHKILSLHAREIIRRAAAGNRLSVAELGAGTADKTQILLRAAVEWQGNLLYEPVDVSSGALEEARQRIESALPAVTVLPQVEDYTRGLALRPRRADERRLLLYIGSSIGNFDPAAAEQLLRHARVALDPGDCILLGVDLVKPASILLPAYNDAAGVTAEFNRNLLARLNRELGAEFDAAAFAHRALWNQEQSRMEMHLVSGCAQTVRIGALDLTVKFEAGESIHTENSYKYAPGQAEALLRGADFHPLQIWKDEQEWFAVVLARCGAEGREEAE